jgi:propionate CoA-transferase
MGGVPMSGLDFGAAINYQAVIDHCSAFDFIDGGGLDAAFLGFGECDAQGNVNASRFGARIPGCGGFINISQNAKKVVFVGTFTAGNLQVAIEDGALRIVRDGKLNKFVRDVEHRTFSGSYAMKRGQRVLYVTERCVFQLAEGGLELVEVAPGIDVERDVLARMQFRPIIRREPAIMDRRIFVADPMGLRDDLLRMPLGQRFTYDAAQQQFFVNFEGHVVRSQLDVERIRQHVTAMLGSLGHKVHAIVNYENFTIFPDVVDDYSAMVRDLADRFYSGATRYTTSSFLRAKLGDAFVRRALAPHIFENAEEAAAHMRSLERRIAS